MSVILLYRLLVGVCIGVIVVDHAMGDDGDDNRKLQTTCLIVVCSLFLLFIVCVRPPVEVSLQNVV